ncbi:NADH-quinone oxidoreductase subunit M [Cupriavidus metallidurans]|jgi:NADH-quinone oxidoreductase subunit M|uniref:NADH:ubiquinone oxidoreductase, membrane subunit M n=2 Tax=Cupriavidus metallidurans TaxID=119219 RepID=Q1LPV1_CUPMC|nr:MULTISPECIES: NADH-quinone oxidoreductase subunit M [Cupriavidus]PCH55546.1 MAG: NADH-quinone oxidoreductase subunit M [Burkholderiaceae bacterium]ABF07825.1 NADH:ubiquinone oxidoreductase, membrane subunit M [Cupriavidus metallidurans CH34]AVA33116.1 NADH-quinone oxidoreductase subunit M [Cupriavidus metallidurans]KWR82894.1 NADH:ubiquinone oxidoreductase subunit M [Cupriavidus sp. SHE]KWW36633.1 NADH-quinone oxidoreductase subunit M [Cupriavidus metallidurans]
MVLSFAIWLPIFFGLVVLMFGSDRSKCFVRWMALFGAIVSFAVTLPLIFHFDTASAAMQFVEQATWIERFNIQYHLGVDGISMWFVVLTAFITVIVVISAWEVITERVAEYMASFLILSGLMVGVFSSLDGLLFYVFFEATLIPMYIIIGVWGGPNRVYAAFKFFLYTLLGSLLTLVALLYLYNKTGSFDILTWHQAKLTMNEQIAIFLAFFMAFAVKVPMWPVHTWLPDAHVEAPTGGSVVLAAIMLKLGAYGFLRFSLPIAPDASHYLAPFIITISLIAVIYIGLVALVQADMKKLVAYSSIAHMGFVTLGFFIFNEIGIEGGIIQMISHGFVSGAMFLCIGVLYDRVHSRQIADYGGVVNVMPKFAALSVFFAMANCGLPATSGFVGEFMVILGAVKFNFWIGLLAATALIFGAAYSLWMVKRVIFGDIVHEHVRELVDLNKREFFMLGLLAIMTLYMGLYPKPFTDVMHASVVNLLSHVAQSKL